MTADYAPPLQTSAWINSDKPLDIPDFRGRVLVIEAFQMLCPGCVSHGLPQAQRIAAYFPQDQVAVIGLHTVFEHHAVQGTREALAAFAHEYRLEFPIGIDRQEGRIPATMAAYRMQGTPTVVVVDRDGVRRYQQFGRPDDLALGSVIGTLLAAPATTRAMTPISVAEGCDDNGCPVPDAG